MNEGMDPEDMVRVANSFEELILKGKTTTFEIKAETVDGRTLNLSATYSLLRDAEGNIMDLIAIIRDITPQKQAEEAIKKNDDRFNGFYENIPEYCYMISTKGKILSANKAALKALGYSKNELIGKPLKMIYPPEMHKKVDSLFKHWKKNWEYRRRGIGHNLKRW